MAAGDIVVGDAVWSVDRGKVGKGGLNARPLSQLAGWGLVPGTQTIEAHFPDWHAALQNDDQVAPRIIVGGIAATNYVLSVDGRELVKAIRKHTGDTVRAVEMESWGAAVSVASYQAHAQKNVLLGMIRGLSDIVRTEAADPADGVVLPNNSDERNQWKARAAQHAARLAVCLIRHCWPYTPKNPNPGKSSALPESPARIAFRQSLFADQQAGWKSLQAHGLVAIFENTLPEWDTPALLACPQDFFNFCTDPIVTGDALLYWLRDVLMTAEGRATGTKKMLPILARKVLLALCTVGIESWVEEESSGVPLPPPNLADGIHLKMNDPWAIYLIAVVIFKCSSQLEPGDDGTPRSLIPVIVPDEFGHKPPLDAVESAVSAFARTGKAVAGKAHPARGHTDTVRLLKQLIKRLENKLIFQVGVHDNGNPLSSAEMRRQVFELYDVPTVVSGDTGQPDPTLKTFVIRLTEIIHDLHTYLYPDAKRQEPA